MPKEWRTKVEFRIEPEGKQDEPITSFSLIRDQLRQAWDGRSKDWRIDYSDPLTVIGQTIADGMTRQQLIALVRDATDMLAHAEPLEW